MVIDKNSYVVVRRANGTREVLGPFNGTPDSVVFARRRYAQMTDDEAKAAIRRIIESSTDDQGAEQRLWDELGLEGVAFVTHRISKCGSIMTMCMFTAHGPRGNIIQG